MSLHVASDLRIPVGVRARKWVGHRSTLIPLMGTQGWRPRTANEAGLSSAKQTRTQMRTNWMIAACSMSSLLAAQNLVPNGSFEEYTECPTSDAQMNLAAGWEAYMYSPDFWHACGIPGISGVPNNIAGYQLAHSGDGYAGIHAFTSLGQSASGYREILGVQLLGTLIPGSSYHVQFFASWTSSEDGTLVSMQYANNRIGVLFSTQARQGFNTWYPLPNYANVYGEQMITDSVNWTMVDGVFVADSAYTYMYVGNFFGDAETEDTLVNPGGTFGLSYYYVDDVCVVPVGVECSFVGVAESPLEGTYVLGPNPFGDEVWLRGAHGMKVQLAIHALTGQEIMTRDLLFNRETMQVDLAGLSSGPFLFSITDGRQEQRRVLLIHE
jgi:hypothetical protein